MNKNFNSKKYAVMAKPVGSTCNLCCDYCYYLDKNKILNNKNKIMSKEVLEEYIKQNIEIHGNNNNVDFAWHGGEPLLAGIDFYSYAVDLQKKYSIGRNITNSIQTNGILINEKWCEFFTKNKFLVGVSIDGPQDLNDSFRRDSKGSVFNKIMNGISLMKKFSVDFNTLTTVNSVNSKFPERVYKFLREISDFMQFLPVVESKTPEDDQIKQRFATPPGIFSYLKNYELTDFSVSPKDYGNFLCRIFDLWEKNDKGKKFIQIFEATVGNMLVKSPGLCVHEAICGHCPTVEINGDVYSCDRYAFDSYKIGNILSSTLDKIIERNKDFGLNKVYGLPEECFDCKYIKLCYGGCPKDRLLNSWNNQPGKNYLCEGYKMFFQYFSENFKFD